MTTLHYLGQQLIASLLLVCCLLLQSCGNNTSSIQQPNPPYDGERDDQSYSPKGEDKPFGMVSCILTKQPRNQAILSLVQEEAQQEIAIQPDSNTQSFHSPITERKLPISPDVGLDRKLSPDEEKDDTTSSRTSPLVTSQMKPLSFNQDWEDFELNYDDSSDEETTTQQVTAYKLDDSIQKFKQKLSKNDPTIKKAKELKIDHFENKYIFSFITHAMGLQVLYGQEVGGQYYPLKSKYLKQELTPKFQEQVQEQQISKVIHKIIHKLFLNNGNKQIDHFYRDITAILVADFKEKHQDFMGLLQKFILQKSRSILQQEDSEKLPTALQSEFKKLQDQTKEYCTSLIGDNYAAMQQLLKAKDYTIPNVKNLPSILEELQQYPLLENGLKGNRENTLQKINAILTTNQCVSPNGKMLTNQKATKKLNSKIQSHSTPAFEKRVLEKVKGLTSNIAKNSFVKTFNSTELSELSFLLFQESVNQEIQQGTNSILWNGQIKPAADIQQSKLASYKNMLHEFIPVTSARIDELISCPIDDEDLREILENGIQPLRNFLLQQERKILPSSYNFNFEGGYNILTFLANIRLCNRSAKRLVKNNKSSKKVMLCKQKQSRGCKFPATSDEDYVLETQEITNKGNRRDLVINSSSYEDVYDMVKNIKGVIGSVKDKDIAYWIKQTFQGENLEPFSNATGKEIIMPNESQKKEVKRATANLTYLLFGTEVSRNPAALIHHQMMLDLIAIGKYDWQDFLIGKNGQPPMLPMEIEKAVQSARALHITYNSLMPYSYMYPKDSEAIDHAKTIELIFREGNLVYQWLVHFAETPIDLCKGISEEGQAAIVAAIEQACQEWLHLVAQKKEANNESSSLMQMDQQVIIIEKPVKEEQTIVNRLTIAR